MSDHHSAMPPDIAKAVVSVMREVKKIGKDATNRHGGYKYVSVDQLFDAVGALMSDAGIFVVVDETSCDTARRETTDNYGKTKVSTWLTCHYDIFIYHESGASYGPVKREIQVAATGPQAYGSGISYAEKYFLRSLFKIPTGEQDADADPQDGLPDRSKLQKARDDGEQSARYYVTSAKVQFSRISTVAELREWWEREKPVMQDMFNGKDDPLYKNLAQAYAEHGASLKARQNEPSASPLEKQLEDAIPY